MIAFNDVREYLLNKPEAVESFPFGPDAYVYKVQDKVFALLFGKEGHERLNLKCEPRQAQELRDIFQGVIAGYHMNKTHWNTIVLDSDVPLGELQRQVDHSYGLIVKSLTRVKRQYLQTRYSDQELGLLDS